MDKMTETLVKSNIVEVFRSARVLVTGGTGFMGQVLIEKLLRTCQIDILYMISRPKKDMTEKERLEKILDGYLYERLKKEQPNCLNKIVLVKGDCEQRGLGLSEDDRAMLIREVNIIFHCAATVRFDAKLWTAVSINVLATKDMLDLAREMPQLKAFVHISTAFSNCTMKEIEEKTYLPAIRWTEAVQLVNSLDQEAIEIFTPNILGDWPNTYSFTKALAEDMIQDEAKGLPIGILRPSIVVNTASEPVVGWINNFYGPVGVTTGAGAGLLKSMHCDRDIAADLVPVDMVINSAIAIAWDIAQHTSENKSVEYHNSDFKTTTKNEDKIRNSEAKTTTKNEDRITIFNYISSRENPITWGTFMKLSESAIVYPTINSIWYYCFCLNKHRLIHNFYIIFLHLLPAIFADLGVRIIGKKPMMWKAYMKIHRFTDVVSYFSTQQWLFHNNNVQNLWKKLSPQDKILFKFDIPSLDWEVFLLSMMKGVRLYTLNESFEQLEEALARYSRLKYLHYTTVYLLKMLLLYVTYRITLHYWITNKDALVETLL